MGTAEPRQPRSVIVCPFRPARVWNTGSSIVIGSNSRSVQFAEICQASFGPAVECRYSMRRMHRSSDFQTMSLSTKTSDEPLEMHAGLLADGPGNGSRFSTAKSPSSNTSTDPHARIFGLSLAAVLAACLVLNAASASTRICQQWHPKPWYRALKPTRQLPQPPYDGAARLGQPSVTAGSRVEPSGTIRSKECAKNEGREEPGY